MPGIFLPEPISDDDFNGDDDLGVLWVRFEILDVVCDVCGMALRCTTKIYGDDRPLDDRMRIDCVVCGGARRFSLEWIRMNPDALDDASYMDTMDFYLGPRREWLGPGMN
jgi:hypothetical protein